MEALIKHIKSERPNLAASSITTYSNVIRSAYRDIYKDEEIDYKKMIKEHEHVLEKLKDVPFNVRKTILSALVVISGESEKAQRAFRDQMMEDARQYNALQKTNKMTDQQKENWISWTEIEKVVENLKKKYYYIFKEKNPSVEDRLNLQKYVMMCCYTMIPPRRALDFMCMKIRNFDPKTENYYLKGNLFFNKYKTAKFSGLQVEKCPKTLESLLGKWIKFQEGDYMFSDFDKKEFSSSQMTKTFNSIFKPKNISVNQLRHIFITEKCQPLIKKLEETATSMGHTTNQQKLYVKIV